MKIEDPELFELLQAQEGNGVPSTGTVDDDDDPADERADENEAPIREASETTEAPEEFKVDDEDDLGHPEDDDADDADDADEDDEDDT
jgi:hypothetical protein